MKIRTPILLGALVLLALLSVVFCLHTKRHTVLHRWENPQGTHALIVLRDSWFSFWPVFPGQSGDAPCIVRLETADGRRIRQKKIAMASVISELEWQTNSVFLKGVGHWTFDNKGSRD